MPEFVVEFGQNEETPEAAGLLDAPPFHRNHVPIWAVLAPFLQGQQGDVLEVASGTGQHAVAFARLSPDITWWPSDLNEKHLVSIDGWRRHSGLANVRPPLRIDLAAPDWGLSNVEGLPRAFLAIFAANVLHIAPWRVAEGLMTGAAQRLAHGGRLFVYGPFKRGGEHTSPSNAAFDESLRAQNPEWGVRDVGDVWTLAEHLGLTLDEIVVMPANNVTLIFSRS
jgi:hypothetical protein